MTAPQTTSASYEVGYRKPPRHTQFQKGQSGNPGGRPRRSLAGRLEELALHEAYRTTVVMEDGHADDVVNDTDDADAIDGDDNDVDDTADADRDDAGGADDDEPARQQADGIDTYGERREAEREPTAPPAVGHQQPEDAPPAGRTPSLTRASASAFPCVKRCTKPQASHSRAERMSTAVAPRIRLTKKATSLPILLPPQRKLYAPNWN